MFQVGFFFNVYMLIRIIPSFWQMLNPRIHFSNEMGFDLRWCGACSSGFVFPDVEEIQSPWEVWEHRNWKIQLLVFQAGNTNPETVLENLGLYYLRPWLTAECNDWSKKREIRASDRMLWWQFDFQAVSTHKSTSLLLKSRGQLHYLLSCLYPYAHDVL